MSRWDRESRGGPGPSTLTLACAVSFTPHAIDRSEAQREASTHFHLGVSGALRGLNSPLLTQASPVRQGQSAFELLGSLRSFPALQQLPGKPTAPCDSVV